jgi:hypothetical protein
MIKKSIVLVLFQFCFPFVSIGQDPLPDKAMHIFGIYTGYSRHFIRDEVASPLIYKGGSIPVLIEYECQKSISRHAFTFYFSNANLRSSNNKNAGNMTNYAENLNTHLGYSYRRHVNVFQRSDVNCYLGFSFLSLLNYRSLNINNSSSFPFFEQINSLGANLLLEKKTGAKKSDFACLKINLPFVSYVTLNERYNAVVGESFKEYDLNDGVWGKVLSNGEFVTFNKLFELQTELSYTKFLTTHISLKLQHQFHFYSLSHYSNLLYTRFLNNQYLLGLTIKL